MGPDFLALGQPNSEPYRNPKLRDREHDNTLPQEAAMNEERATAGRRSAADRPRLSVAACTASGEADRGCREGSQHLAG
jgi:hypothetical protein